MLPTLIRYSDSNFRVVVALTEFLVAILFLIFIGVATPVATKMFFIKCPVAPELMKVLWQALSSQSVTVLLLLTKASNTFFSFFAIFSFCLWYWALLWPHLPKYEHYTQLRWHAICFTPSDYCEHFNFNVWCAKMEKTVSFTASECLTCLPSNHHK